VGKPKGNRPLDSDGSIILQWILKKWDGDEWIGSICFQEGERFVVAFCEGDDKSLGALK